MNAKNKLTITGGTLTLLAILLVAVIVLSNSLLRGARLDLTANSLYTLTEGTRNILVNTPEPINLYYFYSDQGTQDLQQLRNYANRVRELLEEMAAKSNGKITLQVIDPLPFSEEEDRASAYGLQSVPAGTNSENIFFGLAGTNSTNGQAVIPFFQPDKEAFLEYDIAKLIHGLGQSTKPVVGLISGLEIAGGVDMATRSMKPAWAVHQSLQELFEIRQLDATAIRSIDGEIQTLLLVHPKSLSEDALYAIDQFVLRGGRLLLFVDPHAELDASGDDPQNPQAAMFADRSSNVQKLFASWGVNYDVNKVVVDNEKGISVRGQDGRPVRHIGILGFVKADMNSEDVISAELGTMNFSSAGEIQLAEGSTLTLTPLIQSSANAMTTDASRFKVMQDPSSLFANFAATNTHYVLAGRLQGRLKTAFPERSGEGHLSESKEPANMVIVADTDVLSDRLWVQVADFFGQRVSTAFANNGDFVVNAVDNLSGSSDLISIRGRAVSARPFTRVQELRRSAEERFRNKEEELEQQLQDTERSLNELQQAKSAENALIMSDEQQAAVQKFQNEKLRIRKELRQVRRELDQDIEALGTTLKLFNILLFPLLLTIGAFAFYVLLIRRRGVARD